MATSPNEIVSEAIDRACVAMMSSSRKAKNEAVVSDFIE
jgi:hypothetical protein